jgi:hypothetical protein
MKKLRRLHTYLGCFFAPLLLFYVLTGWYQTVYHDRLKSPGDAETIGEHLRTVHVDQIYPTDRERSHPSSPKFFQTLVVIMAVALVITVVLGVILAFRSIKSPWPVLLSLILGFLVPVALLWLGQHH